MRVVGGYLRGFCWLIAAWALAPTACGGRALEDSDDTSDFGGGGGVGGTAGFDGRGGRSGGWTSGGATPTKGGSPSTAAGGQFGGSASGGFAAGGLTFTMGGRASGGNGSGGRVFEGGAAGWAGGVDAGAAGEGSSCTTDCCPANGSLEVYVDPVHGRDSGPGALNPTGVQYPASCRFATLGKALSKAQTGANVIVFSEGATNASPATFRGETFPLYIPVGVTLRGPTPGLAGYFKIAYNGSSSAIVLRQRSTIDGVIVANEGGSGSLVVCNGSTTWIRSVVLQGDSQLGSTVVAAGGVSIEELQISGGRICLDASSPTTTVTITGGNFSNCAVGINTAGRFNAEQLFVDANGDGVMVQGGTATLTFATIQRSRPSNGIGTSGRGVLVTSGELSFNSSELLENQGAGLHVAGGSVEVSSSTLLGNGWVDPDFAQVGVSGVHIQGGTAVRISDSFILNSGLHGIYVAPEASVGALELAGSTVQANAYAGVYVEGIVKSGFQARSTEISYNQGDGMVFHQGLPFGAFSANRILANGGSQLRFLGQADGADWILGAGNCQEPNVISCYDEAGPAIFAMDQVYVDAGYVSWQFANPILGREFVGSVDAHDPCAANVMCMAGGEQRP